MTRKRCSMKQSTTPMKMAVMQMLEMIEKFYEYTLPQNKV